VSADRDTALIIETGQTIMDRVGVPKDRWEIAAQLEVLGFRDSDALSRFGSADLFEAADRILALFRGGKLTARPDRADSSESVNRVLLFVRYYFEGLMFSMPMAIQGVTMLLWGYGLWGAVDLDVRTGSAVALAFIASYIATGGFAWAIVRRGLFYYYQKEGALARWSALTMWWLSVRIVLAAAVPAFLLNLVYEILPGDLFLIAIAYYVALSFLWLNWALVYVVGRMIWLLAVLVAAILIVVGTARLLGWPIAGANMAGLLVADVLTFAVALGGLNRWAGKGSGKPVVNPPRLAVLVYSTGQIFLYGFLYSAFVFTDRILAWTSARGREDFPPYPFWLNARYELGMDLALVVVVVLAGIVEYSSRRFSIRLIEAQKEARAESSGSFLEEFRRFYRRKILLVSVFGVGGVLLSWIVAGLLRGLPDSRLRESLDSATTVRVFWLAAVSYAIFMLALQSVLMLMILSRADLAVRSMSIALAVNLVTGFVISRSIHYSGAAVGLLAGSIVLALLAHRSLRRLLVELDYHYYAAY
jgi:hypothetical protein